MAGVLLFAGMVWYLLINISGIFLAEILIDQGNPPDTMAYKCQGCSVFSATPVAAVKAAALSFISTVTWFVIKDTSKVFYWIYITSVVGLIVNAEFFVRCQLNLEINHELDKEEIRRCLC
ncbi:MAG: hypothetical protein R6W86_17100 [Marinobacter sp.]|uniref:hypothetical protein n=1 Tax=Marinobacter sp. TaxID=50741 RepID=UPI00396D6D5E